MSFLIIIFVCIAAITFGISFYLLLDKYNPRFLFRIKRNNTIIIVSIFLLAISSAFLAYSLYHTNYLITNPDSLLEDYSKIGPYGDLIGGIMNPVVAFIGIIAASLAFYAQYRANQQVQEQFEKQNHDQLFFRLMDSTDKRISNHSIDIHKGMFHHSYEGYQIMQGYVQELQFNMDIECVKYARRLMSNQPELLDIEYYERIIDTKYKVETLLARYENGKEFKEELINIDKEDRWEYLKGLFGGLEQEKFEVKQVLRAIGSIHFYKTPYKERYLMYVKVFEKLYNLDGIFLEGYFNNLEYILSYLDKIGIEKNTFYIEYLIENLASYEKVILFYYLTSYDTSEEFKLIVKKYGIINDLVKHPSYFIDSPSADIFNKELEDILSFKVPR